MARKPKSIRQRLGKSGLSLREPGWNCPVHCLTPAWTLEERSMGLPCDHLSRPLTEHTFAWRSPLTAQRCAREAGACLSGLPRLQEDGRELANEQEGKGCWRRRKWHVNTWTWGTAWHFGEQQMAWHDQDVKCTERKVLRMLEPYFKPDEEGFS